MVIEKFSKKKIFINYHKYFVKIKIIIIKNSLKVIINYYYCNNTVIIC